MKKAQRIIILSFCTSLILSACSINTTSEKAALDTLAVESEMTIIPSDEQVSDFVAKNKDYVAMYETDECYNITPVFVAENSEYEVFKYSESDQSFIMYDGEIYSIGSYFGGYGITSMALADLDKNGEYELYYTFSWGSGIHRSQVGYFEPIRKEIHIFKYALVDYEMILTVNESGDLCVNSATFVDNDFDDSVNFTIKAQDFKGTINFENDRIELNIIASLYTND
ncbi:MAG: hypothetical protein K2N89_00615 [Lachnospiraceae bacterium]|nr:hypothetical protein [Lachnospiraceae bacterium]